MKRLSSFFALIAALFTMAQISGCATVAAPPIKIYSPDEIVAMSAAGQTPEQIINTIRSGGAYYAMPASELARMSKAGAPDAVINYLQSAQIEAVRHAERQQMRLDSPFWYGTYGGPLFCYRSFGGRFGWQGCM